MNLQEKIAKALAHPDNHLPPDAEWLKSVGMLPGERHSLGPNEYETTIQVVDTRTNRLCHTMYGEDWEEVVHLGYNLDDGCVYLETPDEEVIILKGYSTRLEIRLLLASLKAWGYRGE